MRLFLLTLLISVQVLAGFPPTTSKLNGESTASTTFNYEFPHFTGTRTGITTSLDLLGVAGGGTGVSSFATDRALVFYDNTSTSLLTYADLKLETDAYGEMRLYTPAATVSGSRILISNEPYAIGVGNDFRYNATVSSGSPIVESDFWMNNFSANLYADDDIGVQSSTQSGIAGSGSFVIPQVAVGKTVTKLTAHQGLIAPSGTGSTGTITDVSIYNSMGLLDLLGGEAGITNLYGFKHSNYGNAYTYLTQANHWGFYIEDAPQNYLSSALAIGTTSKKVANSSVGLEIGGTTKAMRLPVLTTAQKNALTPLAGMEVYDSDLGKISVYNGSIWQENTFGIVPLADGGTNKNMTASNGSVVYSDADSLELSAVGTAGQCLISGGAGAPTWYAPTAGSVLFAGTGGILEQDNTQLNWDNTSNRLGVGDNATTHTVHGVSRGSTLTVSEGSTGNAYEVAFHRHSNSLNPVLSMIRSRGDEATPTVVSSGDVLSEINFLGYDGTDYEFGAQISSVVDGTPGSNDMPASLNFYTVPDGSFTPALALKLGQDKVAAFAGNVVIGGTTPVASSALDIQGTTGALILPRLTTTQRNALTATAGMIIYNTTIGYFECSNGSQWRECTREAQSNALTLAAGGTITISTAIFNQTAYVASSGGAVTLSTTPFGATDPINGAKVVVIGSSDTDTVTIPANDAANGILGYNVTLGRGKSATYIYNSTLDRYVLSATATKIDLTAGVTGVLPIANGGTNNGSLGVTAGGVLYTDGTKIVNSGAGTSGYALTSGGAGAPTWSAVLTNPMTTGGDIIYGGASGAPTRLANGTSGDYLKSNGSTNAPSWASFTSPTIQRFTSSSGTYTTPAGVRYIKVKMVGGGGSPTVSGVGSGNNGASSTFGTSLLTAGGGAGSGGTGGGAGGTNTISAPAISIINATGGDGCVGGALGANGGNGGASALGGAGAGSHNGSASATAGYDGTGGGGGGKGYPAEAGSGGGGAGGYIEAIISSPSATYSYSVGAGGAAVSGGVKGGDGVIVVEEYYQ